MLFAVLREPGQGSPPIPFRQSIARSLLAAPIVALAGCAAVWASKESLPDLRPVSTVEGRMPLHVRPCTDRTGDTQHDLDRQATHALVEKLAAVPEFELRPDGQYVVSCDISAFVEGSALKRWMMPGWGATSGQVAVMVTDSKTGETVAIIRGRATVTGGGLFTVAADKTILSSALDDVVKQLRQLPAGRTSTK